jgi:hypothetical protein
MVGEMRYLQMFDDTDGHNGTARDDNNLFRNTDNEPNQGRLERIAGEAGDGGNRTLGSRYREYFSKNFEWMGGLRHTGRWLGEYAASAAIMSIIPYCIPSIKAMGKEPESVQPITFDIHHNSAALAGAVTGAAGWIGQLVGYGYLTCKDLGGADGRFNWEYLLIPVAANLVDGVFLEPLRKSFRDIKKERLEHR